MIHGSQHSSASSRPCPGSTNWNVPSWKLRKKAGSYTPLHYFIPMGNKNERRGESVSPPPSNASSSWVPALKNQDIRGNRKNPNPTKTFKYGPRACQLSLAPTPESCIISTAPDHTSSACYSLLQFISLVLHSWTNNGIQLSQTGTWRLTYGL